VVKQISTLVTSNPSGFVTTIDVANALQISLVLAKEFVLLAEQKELLCRDETIESLRFYPNFFKSF